MYNEDRNGNGTADILEDPNDTNRNGISDRLESQFWNRPGYDNYYRRPEEPKKESGGETFKLTADKLKFIKEATRFFTYAGICVLAMVAVGLAVTSLPIALGLGVAGGIMGYKYLKNRHDKQEALKNEPMGPMPGRPQVLLDDREVSPNKKMEMTFTKEKAQDGRTQDNHTAIKVEQDPTHVPILSRRAFCENKGIVIPPKQNAQRQQVLNVNRRPAQGKDRT